MKQIFELAIDRGLRMTNPARKLKRAKPVASLVAKKVIHRAEQEGAGELFINSVTNFRELG